MSDQPCKHPPRAYFCGTAHQGALKCDWLGCTACGEVLCYGAHHQEGRKALLAEGIPTEKILDGSLFNRSAHQRSTPPRACAKS